MKEKPEISLADNPFHDPHKVPLAQTWFDEREPEAAAEVVRSGWLCQGPKTAAFEKAFAAKFAVKHAIAVSNGSVALLVALKALGVGPGDEVIVPDMTFISSATCAMWLGATPIFCDITLTDYNMDPAKLEALITPKTKVILPVHYAGQSADMGAIKAIADKHGLTILEDSAEAHLAQFGGQNVGTIGDAGIFSFTPTKPMTTGEGGMIVTNDDEVAASCRLCRNFGDKGKFMWASLGFNFRLTEVASAIGLIQLEKLDEIVAIRHARAARYDAGFADLEPVITPWVRGPQDTNYQLYTIRLRTEMLDCDRDQIIDELAGEGVSTRLYYPALHHQTVFAETDQDHNERFPGAMAFETSAISLPIYTSMSEKDEGYVIDRVNRVVNAHVTS